MSINRNPAERPLNPEVSGDVHRTWLSHKRTAQEDTAENL